MEHFYDFDHVFMTRQPYLFSYSTAAVHTAVVIYGSYLLPLQNSKPLCDTSGMKFREISFRYDFYFLSIFIHRIFVLIDFLYCFLPRFFKERLISYSTFLFSKIFFGKYHFKLFLPCHSLGYPLHISWPKFCVSHLTYNF